MNTLNRRKFLSSSALLATSSLISVTANAACKDPMPAKWDEEVDVIVVGSGFAGLAAAAEAKNANAGNVIVLEKMRAVFLRLSSGLGSRISELSTLPIIPRISQRSAGAT